MNLPGPSGETSKQAISAARVESIDQYRGYAVFGMILVNYLGEFASMPEQFRHHDATMSYADTIAPLFVFVAGMGARLSLQGRIARSGAVSAYASMLRRYAILILVGIALYGPAPENWRYWWDALVDIGFAGILALPFLMRSARARAAAALGYASLYQILFTTTGYADWTMSNSIDGGPLGPLSWAFMFLTGAITFDLVTAGPGRRIVRNCLAAGLVLCATGWLLHVEWPGAKAEWPFTQRGMTLPYVFFSTGLCLLVYLPFHYLSDVKRLRLPHLSALGLNPLVIYIVQQALGDMHGSFLVPQNSGSWLALLGFAAFYLACYAVAWRLAKDRVIIKL